MNCRIVGAICQHNFAQAQTDLVSFQRKRAQYFEKSKKIVTLTNCFITEYDCPVFHDSLPVYLSRELEAVQKRAMRIIFPCFPYEKALVKAGLVTLSGRRQILTYSFS